MKALRFIYEIFKKFPSLLIITILLLVFETILEVISLLTIGPLVDFFVHPDFQGVSALSQRVIKIITFFGIPLELKNYLIIFITFIVLSTVFGFFLKHYILKTKYAVMRDLIVGTFEDFFNTHWEFFSGSNQGMLLNTFTRQIDVVGDAFRAIAHFFTCIIQLAIYLAIPIYLSWKVTLISTATAFLLYLPFILIGKLSYRLGVLNTSTANRIYSVIEESLSLAKVILGFANQKKTVNNLTYAFDAHRDVTIKSQDIHAIVSTIYRPLAVIVLSVALLSARKFGVPISELAVLLLALLQIVVTIGDIAMRKNILDNFYPGYEQLKILRDRAKKLKQTAGGKIFTGFNKEIIIENLSFVYPDRELTLQDINIRIPKGKMVAIVGESGGGKSSLIDIIMGFNKTLRGRVRYDGIDMQEFDINSYRRHIGYVPQDSVLFNMSIKDNLLWANENATDEEIKDACREANADEFIEGFPDKYDSLVGDRGIRLSGGQRQRIALARAILHKPDLFILDEATSSLDTCSERLIQQAVENIAKETTVIVIAHRLSTIINADYIYVLEKGRLIEEGTYSELIRMKGHFSYMIELQGLETAK